MEIYKLLNPNPTVPPQIEDEFRPVLARYMRLPFGRIKSQKCYEDLLKYCMGGTRPDRINHNYYRYLQILKAEESDGVNYLVNKKNGKLWIHENQVLLTLWVVVQESFKFTSWTKQKQHVLKACAYIDNVPQDIVFKLLKIVQNYHQSHAPRPHEKPHAANAANAGTA